VDRPHGVGADELDLHLLALAEIAVAELLTLGAATRDHVMQPRGRQPEVDEARAGDLDGGKQGVVANPLSDGLSHGARVRLGLAGNDHRDVRGEVSMLDLLGQADLDVHVYLRDSAIGHRLGYGSGHEFLECRSLHPGSSLSVDSAPLPGRDLGSL